MITAEQLAVADEIRRLKRMNTRVYMRPTDAQVEAANRAGRKTRPAKRVRGRSAKHGTAPRRGYSAPKVKKGASVERAARFAMQAILEAGARRSRWSPERRARWTRAYNALRRLSGDLKD